MFFVSVANAQMQPSCESLLLMWQRQGQVATAGFLAKDAILEDIRLRLGHLIEEKETSSLDKVLEAVEQELKKAKDKGKDEKEKTE